MGLVYADITLINGEDLVLARLNIIREDEIKQMTVSMLVDAGEYNLCINETIKEQLNLEVKETRKAELVNGSVEEYEVVGPVEVKCKNRCCSVYAFVLKGDTEPLSGAIPMEVMNMLVNTGRQELVVNPEHPYFAQMKLKGINFPF